MLHASFGPATDVFGELSRLQGLLDQVFRPLDRSSIRGQAGSAFPVINVGTTPDTVEVMAIAPGIDPGSLQVTVDRGLLIVAGERQAAVPQGREGLSVHLRERFAGPFRRVVGLPQEADPGKIEATYRDGILRITVGKRESSRPRRIEVH